MRSTAPMITLPLKVMEETDWITPMRRYIAGIYGPGDHFAEEIGVLHRLRQDVRGANADAVGRDLIYRYYGQLELLDLRIPVNETGCRVSFTWHDSLNHDSITQYSLAFEKASILFNLATVNGVIGANSDDVKVSYNSFQAAAGIYHYIMESFLHAPSTDLSQETVRALCKLMLAQAQESFLDKSIQGQSKPSIIAKVATGAASMYKSVTDLLQGVQTSKNWGDRPWIQYTAVKAKYFQALAQEYQAEALEKSSKFGEAIAFAQLAISGYQECGKMIIPSAYSSITPIMKSRLDAARHKLAALEKDNDYIYHSVVPPLATLPEIQAFEAAKPTSMNELYKEGQDVSQIVGRDIFENLIPLAIHEKSSLYSEEKAALLRREGEKVEVADEELSSALEFLDLPGSLRLVKNQGNTSEQIDVPVIVKDWAVEMSSESNDVSIESVEHRRNQVYDKIRLIERNIEREQHDTDSAKQRYGAAFSQASAMSVSAGILNDIDRLKQSLSSGAKSDNQVRRMVDESRGDIAILKEGPTSPRLLQLFYSLKGSNVSQASHSLLDLDSGEEESVQSWIKETEEIYSKLLKIAKERKNIFGEFKEKVHKDDISSLLILNGRVPNVEETLFKSELAKFQPYQARLDSTLHHQKQLVQEITAVWKKVLSNESVRKKTSSRETEVVQRTALIERLRKAYNAWKDTTAGLTKGAQFYTDLDATASSVQINSETFIKNRQSERSQILQKLERGAFRTTEDSLREQLAGLSVHGQTQFPPLHSPPPINAFNGPGGLEYGAAPTPPPKPLKPFSQPSQPQGLHQQIHGQSFSGANAAGDQRTSYGTPSVYDPSFYAQPQSQGYDSNRNAPPPPSSNAQNRWWD